MKSLVLNRKAMPNGNTLECKLTYNQADELLIYDVIMPQQWGPDDTAVTPSVVIDFLKDAPKDLTVRINSSGGEVGSALAIYNRLLEHPGNVTTIVDGYAFSSAGWLALAGKDRQICNGALFMMHNPYLYACIDSVEAIDNVRNRWESHRQSIVDIFTSRTPMTEDEVTNMMKSETYMSAQESVDKGLFNTIRNAKPETAILNSLRIPQEALNKATITSADINPLRQRALNLRKQFLVK